MVKRMFFQNFILAGLLSVPSLQGHVVKPFEKAEAKRVTPAFSSLFAGTCGETASHLLLPARLSTFSSLFAGTCGETRALSASGYRPYGFQFPLCRDMW